MNRTLIYIDGQLVDLSPGTVIASTFQNADLTNLTKRDVGYTNRFVLPRTPENEQIFENAQYLKSSTTKPYRKLPARVIQNGKEFPNATARIKETQDNYSIDIFYSSFWEQINEKLICDIDFGESITTWNAATIDTCRKENASVLLAPAIEYRQFLGTWTPVMPDVVLPSIKYKDVIETLIENAGYSFEGSIFSDEKYQALALGYSRPAFEYGGTFKTFREFDAKKVEQQIVTNPGAGYELVTFTEVTDKNEYGWYDPVTGEYEATGSDTRDFRLKLFVELSFEVISGSYFFSIFGGGTFISGSGTRYYGTGKHTIKFAVNVDYTGTEGYHYNFGDVIEVRCEVDSAGQININSGRYYNEVMSDNFQATSPTFYPNEILPDITQTDMMKDFVIRFGLVVSERGNVLQFRRLVELINDRANAVDLTSKRTKTPDKITFTQSLFRQNNFIYQCDDELLGEEIAIKNSSKLYLNNETLQQSGTFYNSIFNACLTRAVSSAAPAYLTHAFIPVWTTDPDSTPSDYLSPFDEEPGNRIVLLRGKDASEPNMEYNSNSRADYLASHFNDFPRVTPIGFPLTEPFTYDLGWDYGISENYLPLVPILEESRMITRYYSLSEIDLSRLDFQNLIYDDGVYFILQRIENFIPGRVTKLDLFKTS